VKHEYDWVPSEGMAKGGAFTAQFLLMLPLARHEGDGSVLALIGIRGCKFVD